MLKRILFYTAITGWLTSIAVLCLSFIDMHFMDNRIFMGSLLMPMGILVLCTFYVTSQVENNRGGGLLNQGKMGLVEKFTIVFSNTPTWMKAMVIIGFVYMAGVIIMIKMEGANSVIAASNADEYRIRTSRLLIYPIAIALYGYAAAVFYPPKAKMV